MKNFKNPCWLQKETHGVNSSYKNGVLRCLPYFHLFGVCKSGTTDLFSRLTQHPQILENLGDLHKETTFWSWGRYGKNGIYFIKQFYKKKKIFKNKFREKISTLEYCIFQIITMALSYIYKKHSSLNIQEACSSNQPSDLPNILGYELLSYKL